MHFLLFPPWPRELYSQLDGHDLSFEPTFEPINPSVESTLKKPLSPNAIEFPADNELLGRILYRSDSLSSSSSSTSSYENEPLSEEDENFLCCGSAGPSSTMVIDEELTANCAGIPTPNNVCETNFTGESDGDEKTLITCSMSETPDLMIISPTGIMLQPQAQRPHEHQASQRGVSEGEDIVGQEVFTDRKGCGILDAEENKAENDAVISQLPECDVEPVEIREKIPVNDDAPAETRNSAGQESVHSSDDGNTSATTEAEVSQDHVIDATSKILRPALNRNSRHICSTCYLYAPSSSLNFYLDAWLNQQTDFYPNATEAEAVLETVKKPRKKVKWPSQISELQSVVTIDRWIERGVHVYPHPAYANNYRRQEDSDEEEGEGEIGGLEMKSENGASAFWSGKSERQAEKRPKHPVAVARKREEEASKTAFEGSVCGDSREQDLNSEIELGSHATEDASTSTMHENMNKVSAQATATNTAMISPLSLKLDTQTPSSSRSSSSTSLSSLSSVTNSSISSPTSEVLLQPAGPFPSAPPTFVAYSNPQSPRKPPSNRHSRTNQPIQSSPPHQHQPQIIPKKKYASAVKVTVIGGNSSSFSSEHEAAVRIRGQDPIKNRSMIENYWQF